MRFSLGVASAVEEKLTIVRIDRSPIAAAFDLVRVCVLTNFIERRGACLAAVLETSLAFESEELVDILTNRRTNP